MFSFVKFISSIIELIISAYNDVLSSGNISSKVLKIEITASKQSFNIFNPVASFAFSIYLIPSMTVEIRSMILFLVFNLIFHLSSFILPSNLYRRI